MSLCGFTCAYAAMLVEERGRGHDRRVPRRSRGAPEAKLVAVGMRYGRSVGGEDEMVAWKSG